MPLDLVLRAGAVYAVIMATKHYGIWDSSDDTVNVYNSTVERAAPIAKQTCDYLNVYVPPLPPQREKSFLGVYYYNKTVITLMDFLNMCPTYIHNVMEKVPGIVTECARQAREQYEKFQKSRAKDAEKKEGKICIDDKQLVQPIEPHPNAGCKSRRKVTEPPSEQLQPDKPCHCPKCQLRESAGWSDNKPKCPNREALDNKSTTQLKGAQR